MLKHWKYLLPAIFLLGILVRFLYFPDNIYFGFDQARDAFKAQDILKGDLQTIGPSTSYEGLYHGVFYYYVIAPIYLIVQGSPLGLSVFLRVMNALGIFIIFMFGVVLFKKREQKIDNFTLSVGLFSALLFAISFEQTQFSIYMGNPSLASLSVMLIFFSLALVIFQNKWIGLPMSLFFLGLSIQLEFALFYLIIPMVLVMGVFYKNFKNLSKRAYVLAVVAFVVSVSSFILAELKYNFRTLRTLLSTTGESVDRSIEGLLAGYVYVLSVMNKLNLFGEIPYRNLGLFVLGILLIWLILKFQELRKQLIFLSIWFFGLFTVILLGGASNSSEPLYYTNIGITPSLLLFTALVVSVLLKKSELLAIGVLMIILFANMQMIMKYNPLGTITSINVQQGMLLKHQIDIIDQIYQTANGQPFAVKALTMPLYINTTWSYLFEWYAKSKYGYLPTWGGESALGYPGNLVINSKQSELPATQFLIIEPVRGIKEYDVDRYYEVENYFTKLEWQKKIGELGLQRRIPLLF